MLNEILSLTKMQSNYIEADDMDKINSVLMKKEEVIGKIDNLDKEFLQLYQIVKEEEDIDSIHMIDIRKYDNLKSLKNAVNEINIILDQITKVDKENTEKMRTSIDKIKSELKLVKKGQKAHKGYNYNIGESILIDEKK